MTSLPVTSLSVTSHPVAMLLSVMSNGTFCTTTIVRKKGGVHFRACAEHTSGNDVTSGHVTSCYFTPVRATSGYVTSSNACVMARSPLIPLNYALSYLDILLWYLDLGGRPINNPWKIYQGRQSSCQLWTSVKGIARAFNWHKCLGGIMHLKPTAGC
jgi:hypothetical protein